MPWLSGGQWRFLPTIFPKIRSFSFLFWKLRNALGLFDLRSQLRFVAVVVTHQRSPLHLCQYSRGGGDLWWVRQWSSMGKPWKMWVTTEHPHMLSTIMASMILMIFFRTTWKFGGQVEIGMVLSAGQPQWKPYFEHCDPQNGYLLSMMWLD